MLCFNEWMDCITPAEERKSMIGYKEEVEE